MNSLSFGCIVMMSMVNNIQIQSMYEPSSETTGFESHPENNSNVIITNLECSLTKETSNTNKSFRLLTSQLYRTKSRISLGLLLIATLVLSCLSTSIFKQQDGALAQQYIQTTKYRNLVIDLGNGVKTNAQYSA